ncbi:hypothetical protein IW150_007629, partial [Coemansia sp. RSA 2607]
ALYNVPVSFSWGLFKPFGYVGDICFDELQEIDIRYVIVPPRNKIAHWRGGRGQHRAYFPRLESLTVINNPQNSDVRYTDVYSEHMKRIEVSTNLEASGDLAKLGVKRVDDLIVGVWNWDQPINNGVFDSTNHLFSKAMIVQGTSLTLAGVDIEH